MKKNNSLEEINDILLSKNTTAIVDLSKLLFEKAKKEGKTFEQVAQEFLKDAKKTQKCNKSKKKDR